METKPVILLTLQDGVYTLMIVDDEAWEFLEFNNAAEALLARHAWQQFLYDEELDAKC